MRIPNVLSIRLLCAIVFLTPCTPVLANNSPEVPVVDGKVGSCKADFTVNDEAGKPIYNATIKVTLRYGLFNKRRMDLEIGTNSDGKARIVGLPDFWLSVFLPLLTITRYCASWLLKFETIRKET